MKTIIAIGVVLLGSTSCLAETRIIGVHVQRAADATIRVSISSGVKEEHKADLTVKQARAILKNAKGAGSTVFVGVVAHGVGIREYLPILKTISENLWLDIVFVEGRKRDFIHDNIRKYIEQTHPAKRPEVATPD